MSMAVKGSELFHVLYFQIYAHFSYPLWLPYELQKLGKGTCYLLA